MQNIADHQKVFWIILALILVIGAIPRLLISNTSLPYINHPDEPTIYLIAEEWRGNFEFPDPAFYQGYPPIYPSIALVVQIIMEEMGNPAMGDVVGVLRLISVGFSVLTCFFIALIARTLSGNMAGWLAAATWALAPDLVVAAPRALADPMAICVAVITLWLAVVAATNKTKRHFALLSVACGMFGIFVKYPTAPVLGASGLVILWILVKVDWKQGVRYIVYSVLMAAAAFILLILNNGLGYSNQYVEIEKRTTGLANLIKPKYTLQNLEIALAVLDPLTLGVFAGVVILGMCAWYVARRQQSAQFHAGGFVVVGALLIAQPWAVSVYSVVSETNRVRDVYLATVAAAILLSVALAQLVAILPKRWTTGGQLAVAVIFGIFVFRPQLAEVWESVDKASAPDTRVELRAWTETTLDPGWVLVTYENEKVFNNYWSGLPGSKWFNWFDITEITEKPLQEWRDLDIVYAVLTEADEAVTRQTPAGQAYLDELLLLRKFYEPPNHNGPAMSMYRLWKMEAETAVSFGDSIWLAGYDWDQSALATDNTILLRLYWQADLAPQRDYSLFIHFVPEDTRETVAQWDGPPVMKSRPTYTWDEVTETLISDPISVVLPEDLPTGTYRVLLGLYDYTTGQRLPVTVDAENRNVAGVVGGDSLYLKTIVIND